LGFDPLSDYIGNSNTLNEEAKIVLLTTQIVAMLAKQLNITDTNTLKQLWAAIFNQIEAIKQEAQELPDEHQQAVQEAASKVSQSVQNATDFFAQNLTTLTLQTKHWWMRTEIPSAIIV
jgi:uncharacterized coiled-coil DUF342 family protein